MLITKISRTYQKSINTRNYGVPESWVKVEATYEATIESTDDPTKVSAMLYEQVKSEVIANVNDIVQKIQQANAQMSNVAASGPAVVTPNAGPATPPPSYPAAQPAATGGYAPRSL